jgi:hypothetical protein
MACPAAVWNAWAYLALPDILHANLATPFARCVNQAIEVDAVILLGKEGRLTVIAPLDNVPRHVREIQPVSSWHGSSSFSCVSFSPQRVRHGKVSVIRRMDSIMRRNARWLSRGLSIDYGALRPMATGSFLLPPVQADEIKHG